MTVENAAERQMQKYRLGFHLALAGYGLLLSETTRDGLLQHDFYITERGITFREIGQQFEEMGNSKKLSFNRNLAQPEAEILVEVALERYLTVCYEEAKAHANSLGQWHTLMESKWFAVARLLRHAYAHNGRWQLKEDQVPLRFESWDLTSDDNGKPVGGEEMWWKADQLCSRMIHYVTRGIV